MTNQSRCINSGKYNAGKKRIVQILTATKTVLINGGYAQLTMRRVAEEAGLHLRHLQYYFKTKDQLMDALIKNVCDSYIENSKSIVEKGPFSPEERFFKCIDYLIEDNKDTASNTLFFEFWAMACHDEYINKLIDQLYIAYREYIASFISAMRPKLSKRSSNRRAQQIVILLEGMTLFIGKDKPKHSQTRGIENDIRKTIVQIALSPEETD